MPLPSLERFWIPIPRQVSTDVRAEMVDGDGFLLEATPYDFEDEAPWDYVSEQVRPHPLRELIEGDATCVILQGEVGSGKSYALRELVGALGPSNCRLVRLRDGDDALRDVLAEVLAWERRDRPEDRPWLLVDGLDEMVRSRALWPRLRAVRERARFVVSGRPYSFLQGVEDEIHEHLDGVVLRNTYLAPLRRSDVAAAVRGDSAAFIEALEARDLQMLATRPLLLGRLIERFEESGLPENRWDAYEDACRMLVHENDRENPIEVERRMAAAKRLAACMRLSGRDVLLPDEGLGRPRPYIRLNEVETEDGGRESLRAVLRSGLFQPTQAQPTGFTWIQAGWQDFLAAANVAELRLPDASLRQLLVDQYRGETRIPPPLVGFATWLSGRSRFVADLLVEYEPLAVLELADVLMEPARARLVSRLFQQEFSAWWPRVSLDLGKRLARLQHPRLAEQLRDVLVDRHSRGEQRVLALEIARRARPQGLEDLALSIALDPDLPQEERTRAISYWPRVADVPAELRTILTPSAGSDHQGELRGLVLQRLWRRQLPPSEVFPYVYAPPGEVIGGAFFNFLDKDFLPYVASQVDAADEADLAFLGNALRWLVSQDDPEADEARHRGVRRRRLDEDIDAIVLVAALANLDRLGPSVPPGFVSWLENESFLGRLGAEVSSFRRRRFPFASRAGFREVMGHHARAREALVRLVLGPASKASPFLLLDLGVFTVSEADVAAAMGLAREADERRRAEIVGALPTLFLVASGHDPSAMDQLEAIARRLAPDFDGPDLVRELIAGVEATRQQVMERLEPRPEPVRSPLDPSVLDRVHAVLDSDAGVARVWHDAVFFLAHDDYGSRDADGPDLAFSFDIAALSQWRRATTELQRAIIEAAVGYLRADATPIRFQLETINTMARAKALALLVAEAPDRLDEVPSRVWARVIPEIVEATIWAGVSDSRPVLKEVVSQAMSRQPGEAAEAVLAIVRHHEVGRLPQLLRFLAPLANPAVGERLAEALDHLNLGKAMVILEAFGQETPRLFNWGFQRFQGRTLNADSQAQLASALLEADFGRSWPAIFQWLEDEPDLTNENLRYIFNDWAHASHWWSQLSDVQMGEFVRWLFVRFPRESDPRREGVFTPTFIDNMVMIRGNAFNQLRSRSGSEAVAAVEALADRFPQYEHLAVFAAQMRDRERELGWEPPRPDEVVRLLDSPFARLVRSPSELREAVTAALHDFGQRLRADGLLPLLHSPDGQHRHDEEQITALFAYELRNALWLMGAGVFREVNVNVRDRTDLWVGVLTRGVRGQQLNTVVEAKKASNKKVRKAMREQLVDQYLRPQGLRHGIYLVFVDTDRRGLEADLHRQAAELFNEGFRIDVCMVDIRLPPPS